MLPLWPEDEIPHNKNKSKIRRNPWTPQGKTEPPDLRDLFFSCRTTVVPAHRRVHSPAAASKKATLDSWQWYTPFWWTKKWSFSKKRKNVETFDIKNIYCIEVEIMYTFLKVSGTWSPSPNAYIRRLWAPRSSKHRWASCTLRRVAEKKNRPAVLILLRNRRILTGHHLPVRLPKGQRGSSSLHVFDDASPVFVAINKWPKVWKPTKYYKSIVFTNLEKYTHFCGSWGVLLTFCEVLSHSHSPFRWQKNW